LNKNTRVVGNLTVKQLLYSQKHNCGMWCDYGI